MGRTGGKRLLQISGVADLRCTDDHQRMGEGQAFGLTFLHSAHSRRAGPGGAVHGAFVPADLPDPLRKDQIARVQKFKLVQRQTCQPLGQQLLVHPSAPPAASASGVKTAGGRPAAADKSGAILGHLPEPVKKCRDSAGGRSIPGDDKMIAKTRKAGIINLNTPPSFVMASK